MAIGTAYIKIMPEAKGIESTIGGVVDPAAEKAGKSSGGKYIGALKKVIAGAAIGKWIGDSVLAGADLEQALGGIETLYKDASDKMKDYASQAYRTAGIDSTTYMEQATSFSAALIKSYNGDVDKAADATNKAMIDMADNASKMGTPLESIQAAYMSFSRGQFQLLDNLKLGYGGTRSEAERLLKDAEKITGVHYDINELGDVYEAIHVIQEEMGITGTTQKEAAETISGSLQMVKASYKDLIANLALGNDIYPQLEALGTSLVAMFKNVLPAIGNVVIGIPKMLISHAPEIYSAVSNGARKAIAFAVGQIGLFIQNLPSVASNIGNTIIANMPLIIDKVKTILQNVMTWIAHYAPKIITAVFTIITNIGKTLLTNLPSILRSVLNLGLSIVKNGLNVVWQAVKSIGANILKAITKPFQDAWGKVKEAINKIKSIFPLRLGKIFDGIKLPHFKISGGKIPWGIGGAGKKPSISVEWYAQGGIMAKPTLFGGGEAGAEAIMPLDPFWARMDKIVDGVNNMGGVTINVYGGSQSANDIAEAVERKIIEMQNRRRLAWQ